MLIGFTEMKPVRKLTKRRLLSREGLLFSGSGDLYVSMYKDLLRKYPDYKTENRWELGELPIIRIKILENNLVGT